MASPPGHDLLHFGNNCIGEGVGSDVSEDVGEGDADEAVGDEEVSSEEQKGGGAAVGGNKDEEDVRTSPSLPSSDAPIPAKKLKEYIK